MPFGSLSTLSAQDSESLSAFGSIGAITGDLYGWRRDEMCLFRGGTFAASPPDEPILIKTTRLINMSNGSIANDQAILVNGGTVVEIGPISVVSQHAANVRVVDLTGLTVLPSLIDCHAHVLGNLQDLSAVAQLRISSAQATLWGAHNLQIWLDHGFTTPRDAGEQDLGYGQLALRDSIKMA